MPAMSDTPTQEEERPEQNEAADAEIKRRGLQEADAQDLVQDVFEPNPESSVQDTEAAAPAKGRTTKAP